ncbi:MAG TPA: adenosine deaminase [Chloroflexota bacterium]|nr:adenosine deaminase [Chloroflexota bacterium]
MNAEARHGRHSGPMLAELHTHVGAAVDPALLFSIAHDQGIRLPTRNYWQFVELVTAHPDRVKGFDEYLALFHWTELIQSSPEAMQACVKSIIGGGYRHCNIDLIELRYCPMKRNREGERDLDHIILATTHGMNRALLEYPDVRAGLILCTDRSLDPEANDNIVRKAIKYRNYGVVGIDLAGPDVTTFGGVARLERVFAEAREAGLGITVHTGEKGTRDEMWEVVERLRPTRIGHGLRAVEEDRLLETLVERDITLEICPTSNVRTGVVTDIQDFHGIFERFHQFGVRYCINTDGPEMLHTDLIRERQLLLSAGVLNAAQLAVADANARRASFIRYEIAT